MRVKFLSKRPSLLKILRLVIALLVPVLILLILSFLYGYRRSAEAVSNRIDSMFAYQMEQVDASFDQINGYLTDTLLTNRYVEEIQLAEPEDIGYYRSARNLCSEVATLQSFINSGYTFYFYTPRLNLSFRSSGASEGYMTDYKVVDAVTADIDDGRYNYNDTRWQYYDVDGIGYMVQVLQNDGMYFACWIRAERIFSFFNEIIQSEEGFYAVVGESGRPLTNEGRVEELGIQLSGIHTTCDASGYDCSYVHPSHMAVGILAVDRQVLDMGDAGFYLLLVFVIFLIVLAFCLYIIYYFRRYIQEPLEFFQGHVNSYLQERKFSKRYGFAELNEVENAFSALEAQVRELKIDVYEEKIRRTRTELEFLQNQIKPPLFCQLLFHPLRDGRAAAVRPDSGVLPDPLRLCPLPAGREFPQGAAGAGAAPHPGVSDYPEHPLPRRKRHERGCRRRYARLPDPAGHPSDLCRKHRQAQ